MSKDCKKGDDRISYLPESLLHHILSFLHIKDVARSSVLSKRWNYIWTTVPTLDFQRLRYSPDTTSSDTEKFMDFIDGTLHGHNSSSVDNFFLSWFYHLNESRVRSWISTVVMGNVKELKLYLRQDHPLRIPLSLFTCESLTSLELGARPNITFPRYISFPKLTRLKLWDLEFHNDSWNEELFTNSPVLEELIIQHFIVSMGNFCISIPTLKLLEIKDDVGGLQDCDLKIDTPRLVSFTYSGYAAKEFVFSSFPALEKADIFFYFEDEDDDAAIRKCVQAVAHVKCLTVYATSLEAIWSARDPSNNLLIFHNVKTLNVCYISCEPEELNSDQELIALLKAVPNMESLVFDKLQSDDVEEEKENDSAEGGEDDDNENDDADFVAGDNNHENQDQGNVSIAGERDNNDSGEDNHDKEDDSWEPDSEITGCLFPHLKSVYLRRFVGNPREMRWVKLILMNAKTLERMTIRYDSRSSSVIVKSDKELMVEMPSFSKASADVVIKFCS